MTDQLLPPSLLSPRDRRLGIIAAIACLTVVGIGLAAVMPLLALSMDRMGVRSGLIGFNSAMPALAGILVTPLIPRLLKSFGTRNLLLVSIITSSVCMIAYYVLPNIWIWFPIRLLNGATLTIIFVVSETWINQLAPDHMRGRLMAIYATILSIGFATGPFVLMLVGSEGLLPYAIIAGLLISACVPVLAAGHFVEEGDHGSGKGFSSFLFVAPTATIAALAFGMLEAGSMNLLPLYSLRVGMSEAGAAATLSIFALGNVLCQMPIGYAADRIDRRLLLGLCAGFGGILILMMPLFAGGTFFLPVIFLIGGTVTGLYTLGLTLLGERFRGIDLGAANAAFVMMYSFGALIGPAMGGGAMQIYGPHGLPTFLGGVTVAYALFALWRWRHPPRSGAL